MSNPPLTVTRLDPVNVILLYGLVLDPTMLIARIMRGPTVYNANLRRLQSLTIGTVISKAVLSLQVILGLLVLA